tara:strand:- start:776 stop:1210 length:435 start_codon:yes stop_codon:yes gene_type:complete
MSVSIEISKAEAKSIIGLAAKISRAEGLVESAPVKAAKAAPKPKASKPRMSADRAENLKRLSEVKPSGKPRVKAKPRVVSKSAKNHAKSVLNRKINGHKSASTLALSRGEKESAIEQLQCALDICPANWDTVMESINRRLVKLV